MHAIDLLCFLSHHAKSLLISQRTAAALPRKYFDAQVTR
jgi:hypothetical protein